MIHIYSGKLVDPFNVQASEIEINAIAHQLALINRFNGATTVPYSVAEHCIHVSYRVPPRYALYGLLHDASEAFMGDVVWPMKRSGHFEFYRTEEKKLQAKIYAKFGLHPAEPEIVNTVDKGLAFVEGSALVPGWSPKEKPPTIFPCWSWQEAEEKYLNRFEELVNVA